MKKRNEEKYYLAETKKIKCTNIIVIYHGSLKLLYLYFCAVLKMLNEFVSVLVVNHVKRNIFECHYNIQIESHLNCIM